MDAERIGNSTERSNLPSPRILPDTRQEERSDHLWNLRQAKDPIWSVTRKQSAGEERKDSRRG